MPASLVVRSVTTPVSVLMMVTFAPEITAPVESETVPRRSLELVLCAKPAAAMHRDTVATTKVCETFDGQSLWVSAFPRRAAEQLVAGVFLMSFCLLRGSEFELT